jgi:voltage-dependent calcium channel alpha-2/delta-4
LVFSNTLFQESLVQATPENIAVFNDAVRDTTIQEGYADVKNAFTKAFEVLEGVRIKRVNQN